MNKKGLTNDGIIPLLAMGVNFFAYIQYKSVQCRINLLLSILEDTGCLSLYPGTVMPLLQ